MAPRSTPENQIPESFYDRPADDVARDLVGCRLVRTIARRRLEGIIVETEAYDETEAASHSYRGQTARNAMMFGPPGRLYVYRSYGIHWCMNITTGPVGFGAAVLLRAIEPVRGLEHMRTNRAGARRDIDLARGPGRLTEALAVDDRLQGHRVDRAPLRVLPRTGPQTAAVVSTVRIGISKEIARPWRFCIADSKWVSGPQRLNRLG